MIRLARSLAVVAALAAAPAAAAPAEILWIDLCDAVHPGRRLPMPMRDEDAPGRACHAACAMFAQRRQMRT